MLSSKSILKWNLRDSDRCITFIHNGILPNTSPNSLVKKKRNVPPCSIPLRYPTRNSLWRTLSVVPTSPMWGRRVNRIRYGEYTRWRTIDRCVMLLSERCSLCRIVVLLDEIPDIQREALQCNRVLFFDRTRTPWTRVEHDTSDDCRVFATVLQKDTVIPRDTTSMGKPIQSTE